MTHTAKSRTWPTFTAPIMAICLAVLPGAGCGKRPPPDPRQNDVRFAIEELASDSGVDRRHAVARLEKLLPPAKQAEGVDAEAIKRLRTLVTDDRDDHVRAAAIRTLGKTGDEPSWDIIVKRADTAEAQVRIEVLQALSSINAQRAFPMLVQALGDTESTVRLVAATALAGTADGVQELTRRLGSDGTDQRVVLYGLQSSSLPVAVETLRSGLSSTNSLYQLAAVQAAGTSRHQPSVPILADILTKSNAQRTGISDELLKATAMSLIAIGGNESFLPLLVISGDGKPWLDELLQPHQTDLRPLLIAQVANKNSRTVSTKTLVKHLLNDPAPECLAALGDLVTPDLPELVKVCEHLNRNAPADVRAKVATGLRSSLNHNQPNAGELVTALGLVGKPGDGPDATAAWELLKAALDQVKALKAAGLSSAPPAKGITETPDQIKNRERVATQEALVGSAAQACGQLRASAAAPTFAEFMRSNQDSLVIAGMAGALALGDNASIELVSQTLLTTKMHPWPLIVASPCGHLLRKCHDPRILPGLVALMARGERAVIYGIIAANGTPESAKLLMDELANPALSVEIKRDCIAPLMAGLGATGRPLFLKAMIEMPPPAKRGDPDVGWWSAEFLREQRNAAAPDILAALAKNRPTKVVAARFIQSLDLADSPEAIAAQTSWLTDADPELARLALNSLVRNRRTDALPSIRTARDAAAPGPWRDRLDQAVTALTPSS